MAEQHQFKILLVDDDAASRTAMAQWLERRGYQPIAVSDGDEAIEHIHDGVAVIVTDLKMPRIDGLQLLKVAKARSPHTAVIFVSGVGGVDEAVTALKEGAFDFLPKPINLQELTHRIEMALEKQAMAAEIAALQVQLNEQYGLDNMIGTSAAMRSLFEKIRMVANTKSTVLVTGESGTGKELVARLVHQLSSRKNKPFIPVNCAAIPESLVESELFGHEKGAFTGATERYSGLFQSASGGTLFIDEIGELPIGLQSKLLRALENRTIMPVGSAKEVGVDVRLVAATNRDLAAQVKSKEFREDLYYRLKVVELKLPPLRERRDDIPLLVRHFINEITAENERPPIDITPEALDALRSYDWPGNVRELRNTLEGIIVLLLDDQIERRHLPDYVTGVAATQAVIQPGMTMREIEREAIRRTLQHTAGHRAQTAKILDISVRTLQRKINEFHLDE